MNGNRGMAERRRSANELLLYLAMGGMAMRVVLELKADA